MPFGVEKLEWRGYPMVKKILKIIMFVSFDTMHEREGHTHRETDTA